MARGNLAAARGAAARLGKSPTSEVDVRLDLEISERQALRQTYPAIMNAPAGSTGRVTLTGCRGLLDRVQHPMARDRVVERGAEMRALAVVAGETRVRLDRKSTRLNSSHSQISYAVFCLKKKKKKKKEVKQRKRA